MTRQDSESNDDERLSALIDGEVSHGEAVDTVSWLLEDEQAQVRWSRYHAQRAAMHGERSDWLSAGFAERVATAVAAEPTVVAPRRLPRPPRRWLRGASGGAIAASIAVATAAILFSLDTGTDATRERLVVQETQPVASDGVSPVRLTAEAAEGISAAGRERMSQYLASHAGAAGGTGLPGVVLFSRLSGFNASE